MRLIDADKLIEKLKGHSRSLNCEFNSACRIIIEVVKEQPTAYDVDKVVSKMETEIEENQDASLSEYRAGLYKAIEIVKVGGLNASKENC